MQQAIDILDEMIELEHDKLNDLNPLWKVKQLKERKSVLEKAKSRIQALWDGWIPVMERLPEKEWRYLTICNFWSDNVEIASYTLWKWTFSDSWWSIPNENVTHWMPLPNSPKQ